MMSIALDGAQLDTLELIIAGLVSPINGYGPPETSVEGWPFVPSLSVPWMVALGDSLLLTDPDGTALARLEVESRVVTNGSEVFVGGTVVEVGHAEHPPARALRLCGSDDRAGRLVAVFDSSPTPEQVLRAANAAKGRGVDFLAVTWNSAHGDYSISSVVEDLQRCAAAWNDSSVRFAALASGGSAIDPRGVLDVVVGNIGSPEIIEFLSDPRTGNSVAQVSPTAVDDDGVVVLFSGLSGSGKSTIARAVSERLAAADRRSVLLDGDDVRRILSAGLGFSPADRELNLERIGWVAARVASVGGIALCAPIAPFRSSRALMRGMAEAYGRFLLVYVATPLEICEARDRKGLYARARAGLITDFTGIDSPYDVPTDADLILGAGDESLESMVERVFELIRHGLALPSV